MEPALPAGWAMHESQDYPGRHFYLHAATGTSQWEPPTGPPPGAAPQPEPAQVVAGLEIEAGDDDLDDLEAEFAELTSPTAEEAPQQPAPQQPADDDDDDDVDVDVDDLEAEFAELTSPTKAEAPVLALADDDGDLEAEFAELTSPAAAEEIDLEADFAALVSGAAAGDGGLVFVRDEDPTASGPEEAARAEATDTDEVTTDRTTSSEPATSPRALEGNANAEEEFGAFKVQCASRPGVLTMRTSTAVLRMEDAPQDTVTIQYQQMVSWAAAGTEIVLEITGQPDLQLSSADASRISDLLAMLVQRLASQAGAMPASPDLGQRIRDQKEVDGTAGSKWRKGTIVDIDTEDGWERGVVIVGPAESGDPGAMSVRFRDGSVDDWEIEDFLLPAAAEEEHAVGTEVAAPAAATQKVGEEAATATQSVDQQAIELKQQLAEQNADLSETTDDENDDGTTDEEEEDAAAAPLEPALVTPLQKPEAEAEPAPARADAMAADGAQARQAAAKAEDERNAVAVELHRLKHENDVAEFLGQLEESSAESVRSSGLHTRVLQALGSIVAGPEQWLEELKSLQAEGILEDFLAACKSTTDNQLDPTAQAASSEASPGSPGALESIGFDEPVQFKVIATCTVRKGPEKDDEKIGEYTTGTIIEVVQEVKNVRGITSYQSITPTKGQKMGGWVKLKTSKDKVLLYRVYPKVGQWVKWLKSDEDVPAGSFGKVVEIDPENGRRRIRFETLDSDFTFKPEELEVLAKSARDVAQELAAAASGNLAPPAVAPPAESSAPVVEVVPWRRLLTNPESGRQYRVGGEEGPATLSLHPKGMRLEYFVDPTSSSTTDKREILFKDIRSWRARGNDLEVEVEPAGSPPLQLQCEVGGASDFIADELAQFSAKAHAVDSASTAAKELERSKAEKAEIQAQMDVLSADLKEAQSAFERTDAQLAQTNSELEQLKSTNRSSEGPPLSEIAQELDTVRSAYNAKEAEMQQLSDQYGRELAKRTGRELELEAKLAVKEQGGASEYADPHPAGASAVGEQEITQLQAELAAAKAEAADSAARALAAETKCDDVVASLATAEATIKSLQEKATRADIDAAANLAAAEEQIKSLQSALAVSASSTVPVEITTQIATSDAEQKKLGAVVEKVSANAQAQQHAYSELQETHKKLQDAHSALEAEYSAAEERLRAELADQQATARSKLDGLERELKAAEANAVSTGHADSRNSGDGTSAALELKNSRLVAEASQLRQQVDRVAQHTSTLVEQARADEKALRSEEIAELRQQLQRLEAAEPTPLLLELDQWLGLTSQAEQQPQPSADELLGLKTALAAEVEARKAEKAAHSSVIAAKETEIAALTIEHQVQTERQRRMSIPTAVAEAEATIGKLRADFTDLQVDHEMELAKLERQIGTQARELVSAAEKVLRAEAAREDAEKAAMELAEDLDDQSASHRSSSSSEGSPKSPSLASSQLAEEKAAELQKLRSELNVAKDEKAELLEQIDEMNSKLQAEDQSPRQTATTAAEVTVLESRLSDTTRQLESVTLQHSAAREELSELRAAASAKASQDDSVAAAVSASNVLNEQTAAEVKLLETHLQTTSKELETVRGKYAEAERRRQAETRQAYTQAENKAMIADIFGICDTSGSGVLDQDEYRVYLQGIGAWGTPPRVDEKFDAQWIVECTQMSCDHEVGITWEAFEGHIYGQYRADLSTDGTLQIEQHLAGVKAVYRANLAEIKQDNAEMRDAIKSMLDQHRTQSRADKEGTDAERARRLTAEAEAERLGRHWMDAELARVIELGAFEAVCEAEAHEMTKATRRNARQETQRHSTEQQKLQETLAATRQELSAVMQEKSNVEQSAIGLQKRLDEYEAGLAVESRVRQTAEAAVDAHSTTIEELREQLAVEKEAAKAEQTTAMAKFAAKEAELAVAMAKAEGELGVVATERNAALQTIGLHEQRLAEKEAAFAEAAQQEVATLQAKLKLSDQRLDRVSRHTATLVQKARAEEKAIWAEERRNLGARLKAQEMEIDRVLTVRVSSLQEQLLTTVDEVELRATGVELALREKLEREETSAKAAQASADAEISRLSGLLSTAERTLLGKVPTLESALCLAERETHAARAAHVAEKAEVIDQHAVAIAAAEDAKTTLLQESTAKISAVMAQASESTASISSEMALKASEWDDHRKRMETQLDTISSKLDALQIAYDEEVAAHKKCKLLLADKTSMAVNQEEANKRMGVLLRKAIDEKTASSAALAEKTASWSETSAALTRERDIALKECDALIKRLKQRHTTMLAEVNARNKEETTIAEVEQNGLRARLGQRELAHGKAMEELEARLRTLTHERDMACAELQQRHSSFSQERQQLLEQRDASRTQADEAEISSALAARQLYDLGTELSTVRTTARG